MSSIPLTAEQIDALDKRAAPYNFNVKLVSDRGNEFAIDTAACYGYWERRDGSEGGGLWFSAHESSTAGDAGRKLELIDYDGSEVLPPSIVRKLREAEFIVDDTFD